MRKLAILLLCIAVSLIQACQNYEDFREIDRVDYSPELALPLVHSSLSIDEALEASDEISFLTIGPDGSISLDYTQQQSTQRASDLLQELEDFPIAMTDSIMQVQADLFDNLAVQKLHLKNGTLEFELQSSHPEDIDVLIQFPGLTKNGAPFEISTEIIYEGSSPVNSSINPLPINNFELAMPNGMLEMRYEAYTASGERVLLDIITGMARDWQYDYIEGVWAREEFVIEKDTVEIDIFENWVSGEINFEDPKLHIDLKNSIGFPVQFQIVNMEAITTEGTTIPFSSTLDDGYALAYPGISEQGVEKTTLITLDKNNSNIISVLNARPTSIIYEIVATINPEELNVSGFVEEESQLRGTLSVELPIYGTADNFTLESVSDFDLEEVDEISEAEFKLITDNGIPVDMSMQVYFTDDQEVIIDSLFNDQHTIIAAPETAANGTVTSTNEQTTFVTITKERMDMIQQAQKLKIQARMSTANEAMTPVRISVDQEVEVRAGVKLKVE